LEFAQLYAGDRRRCAAAKLDADRIAVRIGDADDGAVGEALRRVWFQSLPVDRGAVDAAQIDNCNVRALLFESGMSVGDSVMLDRNHSRGGAVAQNHREDNQCLDAARQTRHLDQQLRRLAGADALGGRWFGRNR
jgi:hypothetical protein